MTASDADGDNAVLDVDVDVLDCDVLAVDDWLDDLLDLLLPAIKVYK